MDHKRVTCAVMIRNGRVLLARRSPGQKNAGLWEFPGGKLEQGESIEECLIRELKEELNVEATVGKHIMDTVYSYPENEFKLCVFFVTIPDDAKIQLNIHQNSAWVSTKEMNKYKFPPADEAIIKKLQEIAI